MAEGASANEAAASQVTAATGKRGSPAMLGALARGVGLTLAITIGTLASQFIYGRVSGGAHVDKSAQVAGQPAPNPAAPAAEAKGPPLYHAFEPLIVNFTEDGQLRFLQVTVEVMARDPKTIAAVQANTPVLRNDLLLLVGSRDMKQLLTREGKEQLRSLALQEVRGTMSRLSPDAKVEDLYFTGFVMQ
jgi:flagellar FliL protein